MITIVSSSRYKVDKKTIKKGALEHFVKAGFSTVHALNIVLVGKKKMKDISAKYKHEPVALPVLSFVYNEANDEGKKFLGEVLICYPQAVLMAAQKQKRVDDIMLQLVKHGIDNIAKNI